MHMSSSSSPGDQPMHVHEPDTKAIPGEPSGGSRLVLGVRIDGSDYAATTARILALAEVRRASYVCAANVHMVMEAWDDERFRDVVNGATLVTSDGMPLVWMLRALGLRCIGRVYGPTLMLEVCAAAAERAVPVGLLGGRPEVLPRLAAALLERHPNLEIAYAHSPPFRPLSKDEDDRMVEEIVASGARILFVGLGCPKQERWMAAHRSRLPLVQLGVGAAFDFHAGTVRQAPQWMQAAGLEWLFRLAVEPGRLWRRYVRHNPRFVVLAMRQLMAAGNGRATDGGT